MTDPTVEVPPLDKPVEVESEMAGTRNRIPGVASTRFHLLLLSSVKLSRLHGIWLAVYIEVFTLLTLFTWAARMESLDIGVTVGIAFLTLAVID